MKQWDLEARPVRQGYPQSSVQLFCVQEPDWQCFRLSLKGVPTENKLVRLAAWYDGTYNGAGAFSTNFTKWQREVQVGNYLGALRRGGQLDSNNAVKKYL